MVTLCQRAAQKLTVCVIWAPPDCPILPKQGFNNSFAITLLEHRPSPPPPPPPRVHAEHRGLPWRMPAMPLPLSPQLSFSGIFLVLPTEKSHHRKPALSSLAFKHLIIYIYFNMKGLIKKPYAILFTLPKFTQTSAVCR